MNYYRYMLMASFLPILVRTELPHKYSRIESLFLAIFEVATGKRNKEVRKKQPIDKSFSRKRLTSLHAALCGCD